MNKSRLQFVCGFGRKKKTFLGMEFKNLLSIGRSLLKLEEVMQKIDYAHL
jgi:hypothetical protein